MAASEAAFAHGRDGGRSRRARTTVSYADIPSPEDMRRAMRPEGEFVRRGRSAGLQQAPPSSDDGDSPDEDDDYRDASDGE